MCQSTSLATAFGRVERAISEVIYPLLIRRSSLLPAQLFTGLADDREMILRSADRSTQRSGGSGYRWAYSGISAQSTVIRPYSCGGSLCSRGATLTPRHFFHGDSVRRWKRMAWNGIARRAIERIPVLRGQCEKPI